MHSRVDRRGGAKLEGARPAAWDQISMGQTAVFTAMAEDLFQFISRWVGRTGRAQICQKRNMDENPNPHKLVRAIALAHRRSDPIPEMLRRGSPIPRGGGRSQKIPDRDVTGILCRTRMLRLGRD